MSHLDREAVSAHRATGVGAIAIATLAFGSGPVVATLAPVPTGTIVLLRFWLAVPLLLLVLAVTGRRLTRGALIRSLPGGVLLPLQVGLFFGSARLTSMADATFIMSLQPVVMFVVAPRLFRERVAPSTALWGLLGITGVGLVVFGSARSGTAHLPGEIMALANLFVWAGYLLASKWARSGPEAVGALEYQTAVNAVGALAMGVVALIVRPDLAGIAAEGWLGIAYLTVVPGVLAHVLNTWAQRYVDQSLGSIILLGQPVVAVIGAALLLRQPLSSPAVIGGVCVLCAAAAVIRQASRPQAKMADKERTQ